MFATYLSLVVLTALLVPLYLETKKNQLEAVWFALALLVLGMNLAVLVVK